MCIRSKVLCIALLMVHITQYALGQCATTVSAFPYNEDFETSNGGWFAGGTSSDWAYGVPAKPVINNTATGNKCWIVGGLTNSAYNNGENSWLQSPCYDFTALTNPQISFKVFWETEKKYDGASFRYSVDGGATWLVLGSASSNTNCNGSNWFNTGSISTLGSDGWSGNIQPTSPCAGGAGGGSGGWVVARHTLAALAGRSSVMFRFVFAAGTQCNAYDGFAIDDVNIQEAVPTANTADFTFACSGNKTVNFTNASTLCATGFLWSFGDVASVNNSSIQENPSHVFSATGTYMVSLTVTYPGNIVVNVTKPVTVIDVNAVVTNSIRCNGDATGAVTANVTGGSGSYTYSWNTNPVQTTPSMNNLVANTYTVTVGGTNVCNTNASVTLQQPQPLLATVAATKTLCGGTNATATATVAGGTAPYSYTWSNGSTANPQTNMAVGSYALTVKDANNCMAQVPNIQIKDSVKILRLFLGNDTAFCPGNQLVLKAGTFADYTWQDNSKAATFTVTQTGKYWVAVIDNDGCKASDTIYITVDCTDIYFPTGFTPNGDAKNNMFGPIGNVASVTSFSMMVYGRWGEVLFASTNPYNKWDGKVKGVDADQGTYVWFAVYSINNKPKQTQKGTVTILR